MTKRRSKMNNMRELTSYIAKKEGKKSQVKIGDIREVLSILSDLLFKEYSTSPFHPYVANILVKNGKRRDGIRRSKGVV